MLICNFLQKEGDGLRSPLIRSDPGYGSLALTARAFIASLDSTCVFYQLVKLG